VVICALTCTNTCEPDGPCAARDDPRPRAVPGIDLGLDVHHQRVAVNIIDTEDGHLRQARKDLADSGRVALHRGPPVKRPRFDAAPV